VRPAIWSCESKRIERHNGIFLALLIALLLPLMTACSTTRVTVAHGAAPRTGDHWGLIPFANLTDTPLAAEQAESFLETQLKAKGVGGLKRAPASSPLGEAGLPDGPERMDRDLRWARDAKLSYAITGSVEEWRYKSGVEREPAVAITIRVIEVSSGETLWSASGARTGWGRDSVGGIAQGLLARMLASLSLES
jgi:polysaccharide biosynthesis protein PelC